MAVCLLAASAVQAQDSRAFDVASIKPNNSGSLIANGARVRNGRFTAENVSLLSLLRSAYGVQEFQIQGQPGWADVDRFDIIATLPTGSAESDWPAMLQRLLAERFRLAIRREMRETDVLALVVARGGLKVMPVDPSSCTPPNRCGFSASPTQITARGQSMDQLATRLSRSIGQTVVDRTGVSGIFDYKLEWVQDDQFRAPGASASPAIFTALTDQLGLRLQSARAPVEMIVVDSAVRPTPD